MKHSDFYKKYEEIVRAEQKELIAALKAHGGKYVFVTKEDMKDLPCNEWKAPIISASTHWMETYADFYVTRVETFSYTSAVDFVEFYGVLVDDVDGELEVQIDTVAIGHLNYIIDEIPETETVKDVSLLK